MQAVTAEQLLDELAKGREGGASVATTSLNIVAFVDADEHLYSLLLERIGPLAAKHAMRSIVLAGFRDARAHEVGGEQIRLGAQGLGGAELRSLVHDLLVPNVRSVLLWAGESFTDPRLNDMAHVADTVVLFGAAKDRGVAPLEELLLLISGDLAGKIRDLAYLRLLVWQDLVAQFFDDPELAAELASISRIRVSAGSEPEAYYLVGWLASRLNWEPCGANELCNAQGQSIAIDFEKQGEPRHIRSIVLQSAHCTFGAAIDERSDDTVCLTVKGEKTRPQRCMPLHGVDMVSLIERAIFELPAREIYAHTLEMVGRLLEHRQ